MNSENCFMCEHPNKENTKLCKPCIDKMSEPVFLYCKKCKTLCGMSNSGYMNESLTLIPGERYKVESCYNCDPESSETLHSLELDDSPRITNLVST